MIPRAVDASALPDLEHQLVHANVHKALFGQGATLQIGKYIIERHLGTGGMGEVYLCRDPDLDRKVAIKRVIGSASPRGRARLRREAQALAALDHVNVVAVHDSGEHDGRLYVVMEYVEGQTLRQWLAKPHHWTKVLETLLAAGHGLAAAHAAGIVHRDFKPENVLISHTGAVRVADFGLALRDEERGRGEVEAEQLLATIETAGGSSRSTAPQRGGDAAATCEHGRLSGTGAVLGTREYMPVEQLLGQEVDARSDQFAFCMTLYEALWGEYPFAYTHGAERTQQLRTQAPKRPTSQRAIFRILRRGLDGDRDRRWPDMTSLLDALERVPRRRRLARVAIPSVSTLAIVGALLVTRTVPGLAQDPCAAIEAKLDDTWDADLRARLAALGQRFSSPHAAASLDRVFTHLDGWARAWTDEQASLCVAAPSQQARARARCLERQRRRVATISASMLDGDADTLALAVVAVAELGDPRACAQDPEAIELEPAPAAKVDAVDELRAELERAAQLRSLGRLAEAGHTLDELGPQIETIDYGPLRAEYQAELGRALEASGEAELAAEAYDLALDLAERHHHQRLAADIGLQRAELDVFELGDLRGAELRYEQARRLASRVAEDPSLAAGLEFGRGRLDLARQDYALAEQHTRAALELARAADPRRPQYLAGLAEVLVAVGKPAAALEQRRVAYELATELWGPQHPRTARSMAHYGLALGRDDAQGQALRRRAVDIAHATSMPRERAWADLQAAGLALDLGRIEDARTVLERGLVDGQTPSRERGDALALLAGFEFEAGQLDRAIDHAQAALDQYQASREPRAVEAQAWLANILVERGASGDHERARALLVDLVERVEDHPRDAALAHLGLAELALLAGQLDDADVELRSCARARASLGLDDALAHALLRALVDLRRSSPSAATSVAEFATRLAQSPEHRAALGDWLELDPRERRTLGL